MPTISDVLRDLEGMEAAASRAPWKASPPEEKADAVLYAHDGSWLANVGNWARCDQKYGDVQIEMVETEHAANAALIAAARNALPVLLKLARLAIDSRDIWETESHPYLNMVHSLEQMSRAKDWLSRFNALALPANQGGKDAE